MKYQEFAISIPGPKYQKKDWPCQDSSGNFSFDDTQIIALADGHGSSDCFRSQIGSQIAVDTVFQQAKLALKREEKSDRFSDTGIKNFKYSLWNEWRKAVKNDWDTKLKETGELGAGEIRYNSVSDKYKERFSSNDESIVEKYLYTAYGTTLICAISIGTQILFLQIGDGTCVVLQRNGEIRVPIPNDDENFLNVTVSLCEENAHLKIRHAVLDCGTDDPSTPIAIFLSSDGLDNCFEYDENEQHLYKFYTNTIIENMVNYGYDSVAEEIKVKLLPLMTSKGSRDDISLAYLVTDDINLLRETYNDISDYYKSEEIPEEEPSIKEKTEKLKEYLIEKYNIDSDTSETKIINSQIT